MEGEQAARLLYSSKLPKSAASEAQLPPSPHCRARLRHLVGSITKPISKSHASPRQITFYCRPQHRSCPLPLRPTPLAGQFNQPSDRQTQYVLNLVSLSVRPFPFSIITLHGPRSRGRARVVHSLLFASRLASSNRCRQVTHNSSSHASPQARISFLSFPAPTSCTRSAQCCKCYCTIDRTAFFLLYFRGSSLSAEN